MAQQSSVGPEEGQSSLSKCRLDGSSSLFTFYEAFQKHMTPISSHQ